jgi:1,4-alpha-glucan branching enzyme
MSGMPGICRNIEEGGIGFDYRLAMGIPDFWIKYLKEKSDEEWDMEEIFGTLTNRRAGEKVVSYTESHDQALVGDKTLAFWLMDKEMYFHMSVDDENLIIDRGIALHKLLRALTISLGGDAYLNFIGNEFGHPEWVDFPREGNNWSNKYARRQWSLADNKNLKYQYLENFDKELIKLFNDYNLLENKTIERLDVDNGDKVIIFKKGDFIYAFNFNSTKSFSDYSFYLPEAAKFKIVLNSDDPKFGGFDRIDTKNQYESFVADTNRLSLYLTNRTCLILKKCN